MFASCTYHHTTISESLALPRSPFPPLPVPRVIHTQSHSHSLPHSLTHTRPPSPSFPPSFHSRDSILLHKLGSVETLKPDAYSSSPVWVDPDLASNPSLKLRDIRFSFKPQDGGTLLVTDCSQVPRELSEAEKAAVKAVDRRSNASGSSGYGLTALSGWGRGRDSSAEVKIKRKGEKERDREKANAAEAEAAGNGSLSNASLATMAGTSGGSSLDSLVAAASAPSSPLPNGNGFGHGHGHGHGHGSNPFDDVDDIARHSDNAKRWRDPNDPGFKSDLSDALTRGLHKRRDSTGHSGAGGGIDIDGDDQGMDSGGFL